MTARQLNNDSLKSSHSIAPECAFSTELPPLRLGLFDLGGVLHHGNYLNVLEAAREAFLTSKGISYPELAKENKHLAVVEAQQFFLRPIRYGEPLHARIWIDQISRVSTNVVYELSHASPPEPARKSPARRANAESSLTVLHRAQTKLVFVMGQDGELKTSRLPDNVKRALSEAYSGQCN